jgi:hypothetical protein
MKFFIPRTGPDNVEAFYGGIRRFLAEQWGFQPSARRVHRIVYMAKGSRTEVAVGKQIAGTGHETVYAIFESPDAYLICTPTHGVAGLPPTIVKRKDVVEVADFEPLEARQAV